jgi:hypothetical protein
MRAGNCTAPQPSEAQARVIQAVIINSVMMTMQSVHTLGIKIFGKLFGRKAARKPFINQHSLA